MSSYLCIDLKSFYASVECVERGLDPLTTDLVVADPTRTEKTICLAVSPSLKSKGVRNRCRVFEIPKNLDYIMAPPRMAKYIEHSAEIYGIYLQWIAKEDIHVYSIDEAFLDVTNYLSLYHMSARELGEAIRQDILDKTGIPATCGLGTNLYLAKVALDITAKHSADFFGELDEDSFKEQLWNHQPLSDFWRIGFRTQAHLERLGIHTMGQLALYPDEERLFKEFGIDAEIMIDHAWGIEPVTIADIKGYKSQSHSITNAQVLGCDYSFGDALVVVKEMADATCLELVSRQQACESVTLTVSYAREEGAARPRDLDPRWWRGAFGQAHGTVRMPYPTNARSVVLPCVAGLFEQIADRQRKVHNIALSFNNLADESVGQLDLFADAEEQQGERSRQEAILDVQGKFGKNALVKGIDLLPNATQRERNRQIGGHRSGE